MDQKRIGALLIGRSPRPDLISPLHELIPNCEIIQAGALDNLPLDSLPNPGVFNYPLITKLQNGSDVTLDESFIAPYLQTAQNRLEEQGVSATILLCTGTFADLHGTKPIFRPFEIGCRVLSALNLMSIGLVTPVEKQVDPLQKRWQSRGWNAVAWNANLEKQDQKFFSTIHRQIRLNRLECIVLDFVGLKMESVLKLRNSIDLPVLDLGYLALVALASTL